MGDLQPPASLASSFMPWTKDSPRQYLLVNDNSPVIILLEDKDVPKET